MQFDPFVIPFNLGLYFILLYAVGRSVIWFLELSRADKLRLQRGFFGNAFALSLKEIFMESLIHRKIFKANFRLGYMHMSLAFGWFLLIVFGTIEADVFGSSHLNAPYKSIFFRFFNPEHGRYGFEAVYGFLMDFILAFILSGLLLAIIKRFSSRALGMKKRARLADDAERLRVFLRPRSDVRLYYVEAMASAAGRGAELPPRPRGVLLADAGFRRVFGAVRQLQRERAELMRPEAAALRALLEAELESRLVLGQRLAGETVYRLLSAQTRELAELRRRTEELRFDVEAQGIEALRGAERAAGQVAKTRETVARQAGR